MSPRERRRPEVTETIDTKKRSMMSETITLTQASSVGSSVSTERAGAPQSERLLTRSEVARILGVSPTTVTRWAREGRLACRITLGGHHRFAASLIETVRQRMAQGVAFPAAALRHK